MARVTVEDCVDKIPNRFDLVLLASQRARAISAGAPVTLDRDNDKNPVVALREVADETVSPADLLEATIYNLRKNVEVDEPEEDDMSLLMAGQVPTDEEPAPTSGSYAEAVSEFEVPAAAEAEDEPVPVAEAAEDPSAKGLSGDYFSANDDVVEVDESDASGAVDKTD